MTKKRIRKHRALANQIRDRLEELRQERGLNYSQFAKAAGVPLPQYNAWRNDGVVPGGNYLKIMAERLFVTTDWLLCVEGAQKRQDQSLPDADVEREIGAYVMGALPARLAATPWGQHVSVHRADDTRGLGKRIVELGLYHLLYELQGHLSFLARGEPVRLPMPFRAHEYQMEQRGRAALRSALITNAPPWPGLSTHFGSEQDVIDARARELRQRPERAALSVGLGPAILGASGSTAEAKSVNKETPQPRRTMAKKPKPSNAAS